VGARCQAGEAVAAVGGRGRPGLAGLLGPVVVGVDEHGHAALAGITGRGAVTVGVVVDGARDRSVLLLLQEVLAGRVLARGQGYVLGAGAGVGPARGDDVA